MRHIRPNRCGYIGYVCVGIPDMGKSYKYTKQVYDATPSRISNFDPDFPGGTSEDVKWSWLDDYLNVPFKASGMTMNMGKLVDFAPLRGHRDWTGYGWVCPNAPTGTCIWPMEIQGIWRYSPEILMEASGTSIDMPYASDAAGASWEDIPDPVMFTEKANTSIDPADQGQGEEYSLLPAPLDILVTNGPRAQIGISNALPADRSFDSNLIMEERMQQWNTALETTIGQLTGSVNNMIPDLTLLSARFYNLLTMLGAANAGITYTGDFIIRASSGNTVAYGNNAATTATYTMNTGHVRINGRVKTVQGLAGLRPPFFIYVTLQLFSVDVVAVAQAFSTPVADDPAESHILVSIGNVTTVSSGTGEARVVMDVLRQERRTVAFDIIRTGTGVLYRRSEDVDLPYMALDTAPCPANSN